MKNIPFSKHKFDKVNLVSIERGKWKGGDKYKCSICGMTGHRQAFYDYVTVTEKESKKKCSYTPVENKRPKQIETIGAPSVGIDPGIYDVVDAPAKYSSMKNDIWVFSKERNEPVRLLNEEITNRIF